MYIIRERNVQQALPVGIRLLQQSGVRESTRAGDVLRFPSPVTTVLEKPCERVVFHQWRDANPFFHIVEAAWMLAGRDDLKQLTKYVKRMKEFSDDGGVTQPGAYGKRWRDHIVYPNIVYDDVYSWSDQLNWAVKRLRANPNDRRVVIQMWDPYVDIKAANANGNDVPCNLIILPWAMDGALHFTIYNRSNDIIWGLYGANAVHFSICLEYLAGRLGLDVGTMTTVSNNFHAYVDRIPEFVDPPMPSWGDGYTTTLHVEYDDQIVKERVAEPFPLFYMIRSWPDDFRERVIHDDLVTFFDEGAHAALENARWPWLKKVLAPMALAHEDYRRKDYGQALASMDNVQASDWRLAGKEWIKRRAAHVQQNR